ncbi:MAG: hypothetical protein JSS20_04565 [Proteobacteria bacterium]|nr:hypothetical protein [Pseudomonadota bacterium]
MIEKKLEMNENDGRGLGPQMFWSVYEGCAHASEPIARGTACAQLELASLIGRRMQAWAALPQVVMRCRSPIDLMQAQFEFWQMAGRHYGEASERVTAAWRNLLPAAQGSGAADAATDRDYLSFQEPKADTASEARRHPGEKRRAA